MNANNGKNLILGAVKGYEFEQIKPFLISLKNSGFEGDVCFLSANLSSKTTEALQEYGVHLYSFKELYFYFPFLDKNGRFTLNRKIPIHYLLNFSPLKRLYSFLINSSTFFFPDKEKYLIKSRITQKFLHVMTSRYLLYYLYLYEHGKNYSNVMLTDVRDVLFQRDPFDFEFDNCLCCFLEDKEKTLSSCSTNSRWLRKGFGNYVLREIGNKMISCAGTTIGTRPSIMLYLEAMIDCLVNLRVHAWGIDQGVHNYILYKGLVKNVRFYENHHGPVLTMMYVNENQLRFNSSGFVINDDGSVINVLHQYDRHSSEVKNKMVVYRESESTL